MTFDITKVTTLELKKGCCQQCGKDKYVAPNDICLKCIGKNIKSDKQEPKP